MANKKYDAIIKTLLPGILLLAVSTSAAHAEDPAAKIQSQLQDPLANIKAVMSDNDVLIDSGDNEPSYSFSIQPLYGMPFEEQGFNLMSRAIIPILGIAPEAQKPVLDDPLPPGGSKTWGLSDMSLQFFLSPRGDDAWKWGVGPWVSLRTRTDSDLAGPGWGAGPIGVVVGDITESLSTAIIGGHLWGQGSYSTTILQPMLFYNFPQWPGWEIQYNNTISYDWNAPSGDRWTIPLGLGIGKTVMVGDVGFNVVLGYYHNIEKPDGAADGMIRLSVNFVIP